MTDQIRVDGIWHAQVPVTAIRDTDISIGARLLYADLMGYAGPDHTAFPSRKTLAEDMGRSIGTIDRWVEELEKAGWLTVTHRYDAKKRVYDSNLYTLHKRKQRGGSPKNEATSDAPGGGKTAQKREKGSPKDETTLPSPVKGPSPQGCAQGDPNDEATLPSPVGAPSPHGCSKGSLMDEGRGSLMDDDITYPIEHTHLTSPLNIAANGASAAAAQNADSSGDTLGQGQNAEDRTPSQNPTPPGSATAPSPRDLLARPIREVKAAVKAGEVADLSALLERERDGKARKTLIAWLEARADTFPAAVTEPMREAIRAAFGWEVEHMTDNEHGQVATAAKGLLKAGYAPDHVATIYAHCAAQGWSGGFGPTALLNHASAAVAAGKAKPNGKPQNGAGLRAYLAEYADEIASRETAVDWS
jgi:hypothetical protein